MHDRYENYTKKIKLHKKNAVMQIIWNINSHSFHNIGNGKLIPKRKSNMHQEINNVNMKKRAKI